MSASTNINPDQCVWIATTTNNINKVQPVVRREFVDIPTWELPEAELSKYKPLFDAVYNDWKRGDILTPEMVGEIWYYNSKADYYTAPFISGGGLPMVSEAAKRVLERYDLGTTVFHPITLMNSEETARTTSEPYYLLNVANKRSMGNYDVLGPEGDNRAPLNNRHGIRFRPQSGQEAELVVIPEALGGPDIWLDPKVPEILFLSDALVQGLKASAVDEGWGLVRCAVGTL
ncbi:MAG: DUF1629 domain-containing protein [Pseudomonadota bacterium]